MFYLIVTYESTIILDQYGGAMKFVVGSVLIGLSDLSAKHSLAVDAKYYDNSPDEDHAVQKEQREWVRQYEVILLLLSVPVGGGEGGSGCGEGHRCGRMLDASTYLSASSAEKWLRREPRHPICAEVFASANLKFELIAPSTPIRPRKMPMTTKGPFREPEYQPNHRSEGSGGGGGGNGGAPGGAGGGEGG